MFDQPVERMLTSAVDRYRQAGFAHRIGYGQRPALLVIDLARAWTEPGAPFYCSEVEDVIPAVVRLLTVARDRHVPVIFTTTAYEANLNDAGLWIRKIPSLHHLLIGTDLCKIDGRLTPAPGELVLVKKRASAFSGTPLAMLLTGLCVDTLIIAGVSTSGCVRHTAEDCIASGLRPIVVREAVGDRIPGATAWNLSEIDAKIGDVESTGEVISYLAAVGSAATIGTRPWSLRRP